MITFLSGAVVMGCAAVALFFLEYRRKTKDPLFAILAVAFLLLAVERVVLAFMPIEAEGRHWVYVVRLAAFALIIGGVVEKNRPKTSRSPVVSGEEVRQG